MPTSPQPRRSAPWCEGYVLLVANPALALVTGLLWSPTLPLPFFSSSLLASTYPDASPFSTDALRNRPREQYLGRSPHIYSLAHPYVTCATKLRTPLQLTCKMGELGGWGDTWATNMATPKPAKTKPERLAAGQHRLSPLWQVQKRD